MSITRHSFKWIFVLLTLCIIMGLSCTQKNPLDSTGSILGNQPNLVNMKAEPAQVAAGGGISVIQVTLLNQSDQPLQGGIVTFMLSGEGRLDTTAATTDTKGIASVNFFSGTKGAQSKITASYGNSVKVVQIQVISASSGQAILLVSSLKSAIYANGVDTTLIDILMVPEKDMEVENALINLSTSFGTIPYNVILNKDGEGRVTLLSDTSHVDTQAMVSATYGSFTAMTAVPVKAVNFTLNTDQTMLPADGKSTCKITATVNQKSNGKPIPNADIILSSEKGDIQNQINTEVNGKATVTLTSTTTPDTTVVKAWYGEMVDSLTVIFYSNNVSDERSRIKSLVAENPEIWANPTFQDMITVEVMDADGAPKENATVYFESSAGLLSATQVLTNAAGQAFVYLSGYESDFDSTATVTADLYNGTSPVEVSILLKSESFKPKFIEIRFEPPSIGVIETGQISTTNVLASVKDAKYRSVGDNIRVFFDVIEEPGGIKVTAVTDQGVPTVDGVAKITCTSGTRSGTVRMRARLLDDPLTVDDESLIEVESTKLIIHAGPPFMADRNDPNTSHLSVVARRSNIWQGQDTTQISVIVGDKYRNPCDWGTAIYLTSTGGVITTQSYTDQNGIAIDTLFAGSPSSNVNRYHGYDLILYDANVAQHNGNRGPAPNYLGTLPALDYAGDYIWNPNYDADNNLYDVVQYIPGDCADFEGSEVPNTNTQDFWNLEMWDLEENDGISRIRASTIGMDANGDSIYVWNWTSVIFSGYILEPIYTSTGIPLPTRTGVYLNGFREHSQEAIDLYHILKKPDYINSISRQRNNFNVPITKTNQELFEEFFPDSCGHMLFIGESISFPIRIYDWNGNPIHCGAVVKASLATDAPLGLSWQQITNQSGTGTTFYDITVSNTVNFEKPETGSAAVHIEVDYLGGNPFMDTKIFKALDTDAEIFIRGKFIVNYPNP
ncbi:Ig-like domain-containing protein [bacterium]